MNRELFKPFLRTVFSFETTVFLGAVFAAASLDPIGAVEKFVGVTNTVVVEPIFDPENSILPLVPAKNIVNAYTDSGMRILGTFGAAYAGSSILDKKIATEVNK